MVIVVRRLLAVEVVHQGIHQHLVVNILIIRNLLNQQNVFCTTTKTYKMGKILRVFHRNKNGNLLLIDFQNLCLKNMIKKHSYFHSVFFRVVDSWTISKDGQGNNNPQSNTSFQLKFFHFFFKRENKIKHEHIMFIDLHFIVKILRR